MPVMDGLTATRAIRHQLGSSLSIIAMTANAFGDDRAACLGAGMNDHIAKPVDPEQLYLTLLRWLPLRQRDSAQRPPVLDTPQATAAAPAHPQPKPLAERLVEVEGFNITHAQQAMMGQWPVATGRCRCGCGCGCGCGCWAVLSTPTAAVRRP